MSDNKEKVLTSLVGDFAGGTPIFVHVKDDRIVRVRAMIFGEDEARPWSIKVGNRVFSPPKRSFAAPYDLTVRRRTYNPKRAKYPLKRADFKPGGKSNTANRGKSEYVRIGWDEALDIVASEMTRIKATYGNSAILTHTMGHCSGGLLNQHGLIRRVLNFWGGHTIMNRNPDSWEGWYWGAEHVWGFDFANGNSFVSDLFEDTMQHSDISIFWSYDMEQSGLMTGGDKAQWLLWMKELGKKLIFISPDLNYTAGTKADKQIYIRPGTDAALAAAIAFIWISEDTYDKDYVRTHTVGFEKWKEYILGKDDGTPKTPDWSESITGVPARVTRALAREWASHKTHLCIQQNSGAARTPYSTEWPRMMIFLQAMQGIGKPGISMHGIQAAAPMDLNLELPMKFPAVPMIEVVASNVPENPVKQGLLQTIIPEAILNPPVSWYGREISSPIEEQFIKRTYPMTGCSEIHMIWWSTTSTLSNWNNTNRWAEAYRHPKIEFTVAQTQFMENDTFFADIILPVCTQLEREDFNYQGQPLIFGRGGDWNNLAVVYMKECIKPLYESKSDYEICRLVAERLGVEKEYTEGNTPEDWIRKLFEASSLPEHITFEEFKEKGYYVFKFPEDKDYERNYGMRDFAETATGLKTPSGKIEFFSQRLADNFPDDKERPPTAKYVFEGETHQESLNSTRAEKYPLLMESPHPRFRFHSQHETVSWLWEIPSHKFIKDGESVDALWINPADAESRGIEHGDLVRIFNERGQVLRAAHVTGRMMPGVVRAPNGAGYGTKFGAINAICPLRTTSKNAFGMVTTAYLVEVEKWEE